MQSNRTSLPIALLTIAMAMVVTISIPISEVSADEQSYDRDLGTFYSMTVQFQFAGSDAETISWDFGDGTAVSTEWNPRHVFAATGTYYVTQTLTNSYNGGSTSTEIYKVTIAGYPTIQFDSNGGSDVADIAMTEYNVTIEQPADPMKDGCTFAGWFTDSKCTAEYDWTSAVTAPMTLYAGWTATSGDSDPDNTDWTFWLIIIVCAIVLILIISRFI